MVATIGVIDSRRLVGEGLWDYRPLFLLGKKASKSAYQLIEEIFSESIKQNTASPIIAKQTLASRLAVSDKTIQRNSKTLANNGQISCIYLGDGKYQYQLLYQGNFPLPESCIAYDCDQDQTSSNILPVPTNSLPISPNTPSTIPTPIIESPTTITPAAIMITVPEPNTTAHATSVASAPTAIAMPAATPTNTITTPAPAQQPATSLPYTDEQINQIIENLSEEEQDSLIDQIVELLNEWDVTRASELTAIRKRCRTEAFYEQYVHDMAAAAVNRRYAISVLSHSQCTNNHSDNTNNSQQVTNQTTTLDQNTAQDNLVFNLDHTHLDTNVQANNTPTLLSSDLETKDINVHLKDHDPIDLTTPLDILGIGHKCPPLTFSFFTGLGMPVTTSTLYPYIETSTKAIASYVATHTQSQLHACVHARVREEKDLREVKVNKVIYNFLTSTFLGSGSQEKEHGSGTNTNTDSSTTSTSITDLRDNNSTNNQTQPTTTPNPASTTNDINPVNTVNNVTNSSNTNNDITSNTANVDNEIPQNQRSNKPNLVIDLTTRKSINRSENRSDNNIGNSNDGDVTDNGCENEVIDAARVERRRLDEKISSNDFALWKIVNGDRKIKQDEDGNYLLPNELNNYPKSKYSFWDILAYAQAQKSIKTPAGFSVKNYYSGGLDNSPTFQKYLEEKANSLVGSARKPTEPTPAEKALLAEIKQDLDYQITLNNLGEELWQHLSSGEQQALIAQEIEKLKSSEFFYSHYSRWPKAQLEAHVVEQIKTQLAKAEMCRRERLEMEMSLAS